MRILYVTTGFPYPLTSGFLRHYHFIKLLSAEHQIVLVSEVKANFDKAYIAGIAPYTERVIVVAAPEKRGKRSVLSRMRLGIIRLFGMNQALIDLRKVINDLMKQEDFDLIIFNGKHTLKAFKLPSSVPMITDMCDAQSKSIRLRIANTPSILWKIGLWFKMMDVKHLEQQTIGQVQHILSCSARDLDIVPPHARAKSSILANGVDSDYWKRQSPELGKKVLIFTGVMGYEPNSDAALYLINEILPRVRQVIPDLDLLIVGHSASEALIKAGEKAAVTITGFVEDLRPYLEKASVFVAPLRFGSGIQNKLLEAMAMELPVVTSSLGANGIRVANEALPVVVADDIDSFVSQTIAMLRLVEANSKPQAASREYVKSHFSWEKRGQELLELVQSIS